MKLNKKLKFRFPFCSVFQLLIGAKIRVASANQMRVFATWYARSLSLVMSTDSCLLLVRVPLTLVSRGGSRDRTHKTVSLAVSVNRTWGCAKFWQRTRRVLVKGQLVSVYIHHSVPLKFTTLTWITWNGSGEQSSRCPVYNGVAYIIDNRFDPVSMYQNNMFWLSIAVVISPLHW
jgi:hypothetical protein